MGTLLWIVTFGLLMGLIALIGAVTLILPESLLERVLEPLVGLAAGSLLGGAFFHLLPTGIEGFTEPLTAFVWLMVGFVLFFLLEQTLHWHRCRDSARPQVMQAEPVTWLILLGDGVHNFVGGLAVGGAFVIDVSLGITAWLAAAAHEVPQELGDFAVLVRGGWPKGRALLWNLMSALTFLVGGIVAWAASFGADVTALLPFAAGNFIYIGAADLIPAVATPDSDDTSRRVTGSAAFVAGLVLLYLLA